MSPHTFALRGWRLVLATIIALVVLAGCSGDKGDKGDPGAPGAPGTGVVPKSSTTSLSINITGVTINSPPVVEFTVSNEDGFPVGGLSTDDLRFTLAKLMPGTNGSPDHWQSYIVRTRTGATGSPGEGNVMVQATRDQDGFLVDNLNGSYSYEFQTDVTNVVCPAPCTDADGNPLDLSYQPNLTHRLGIQTRGSLPMVNSLYTFIPATGTEVASGNEIVKTASCNECHNELEAHDARIETGYCVTCHNPGSTDPSSGNTVDFKVMIHKLHRGEDLPSVVGGGEYAIWGYSGKEDFSNVAFPQDIRNCTKCHDGSDPETPQGDAWQTPSIAACGSCHDDVNFADGTNHDGGAQTDLTCLTCHRADGTGLAKSAAQAHEIPVKIAREAFQFNIEDVSGGAAMPSIQISVTDPTNNDAPYDLATDEFTGAGARLALIIGWGMTDFDNTGGTTQTGSPNDKPTAAMPISIDPVAACGAGIVDWTCTPNSPSVGIYTLTKSTALPASATGTGRVGFEGHVAADFNGDMVFDDQVPVKSVVKDFVLTGTLTPRRQVVDIAKCDNCHDFLSLHGGNRNDEPALCVICHNPNATDIGRRPIATDTPVLPTTDGKVEEAIDFKRLIHGIHAGAQTNYDGSEAHGFREKGLVVWGFPGAPCDAFGGALGSCEHDFSHMRFPGILQDCDTCHISGTYELEGVWEYPTTNGILSSTINTGLDVTVPTDDLNISPTAAVCSSCHDSFLAQSHMVMPGGALFGETQANIDTAAGITPETCALCHGPGRSSDVEVVHAGR